MNEPQTRPRRIRRRLSRDLMGGGLVVLLAAGGGTAWALDRFVIPHVEIADVSAYESHAGKMLEDGGRDRRLIARAATGAAYCVSPWKTAWGGSGQVGRGSSVQSAKRRKAGLGGNLTFM